MDFFKLRHGMPNFSVLIYDIAVTCSGTLPWGPGPAAPIDVKKR